MQKLIAYITAPMRAIMKYRREAKRRAFLQSAIEKADYQWRTLPRAKMYNAERRRLERQLDSMRCELELMDGRLQ
ncbi:hypothetical protein O197_33 [Edwardsiella phage eiAU-183]|uniref:Uncharacterized protein n=2 Tax=Eiauvirus eiAU TaxID=1982112 RepID=W0LLW4_9CAUD|nr:hypothetical protein CH09_gp33 [Edwardsiella phage eiAU-183]YP_009613883.1 hypothetical protein FDI58_gp33 [Edwardsiella phage eiAU]AHG23449.1 hypothetical protein P858_33 [Edwardsiella phage eiAU]AHG23503.1 hypothetical protein O197_33 [Edwardsiella phage eiAU-183]